MKKICILLLFVGLSACSATGPQFKHEEASSSDKALVYFYRPSSFTAATRRINFSIDDKIYIKLKNAGYTRAELDPGTYSFKQSSNYILGDPAVLRKTREFRMRVEPGETYFLGFYADSAVGAPVITANTAITPIAFKYGFGVVERKRALFDIRNCHYQKPD